MLLLKIMSYLSVAGVSLMLTACAVPGAPQQLAQPPQPPAGQVLLRETRAVGTQNYRCARAVDGPPSWRFVAPEAVLADTAGNAVGKHYGGPTWELNDGSAVVGEVKTTMPSPVPSAIPWLLLAAKPSTGSGALSSVTSIQRVQTVGGITPAEPCTVDSLDKIAKVPYTATYYFYRAGPL